MQLEVTVADNSTFWSTAWAGTVMRERTSAQQALRGKSLRMDKLHQTGHGRCGMKCALCRGGRRTPSIWMAIFVRHTLALESAVCAATSRSVNPVAEWQCVEVMRRSVRCNGI
ncbi:hypothetical protein Barb4_05359 [Bacteroidales bacterium Barb4]|nr:hypothetical protein Barb4_05359 [Bacteroidales bacterium Barb4]